MMHPPFGNFCLAFGIASLLGKPLGLELDSTATVRSKGGEFSPWERGWEVAKVDGKSQTGFLDFLGIKDFNWKLYIYGSIYNCRYYLNIH